MGKKRQFNTKEKRTILVRNKDFFNSKFPSGDFFILGLDFALNATGVIVLDNSGKMVYKQTVKFDSQESNTYDKLKVLYEEIQWLFDEYDPKFITYEDITNFRNPYSAKVLCFAACTLFCNLFDAGGDETRLIIPFIISQLKKCAIGHGSKNPDGSKIKKEDIIEAHEKRFGIELDDDNQADAFSACRLVYASFVFFDLLNNFLEENEFKTINKAMLEFSKLDINDDHLITEAEFEILLAHYQKQNFLEDNDYDAYKKVLKELGR
ncbi:MAG: hypothetical protein CL489_16575 [Acidobacteria bacterium]|nr:hypothetical protein [Acidobacteriota bacterium]